MMVFWIFLDLFLILTFLLVSLFVSEKYKGNIAGAIMIILTFISAFRYGVAADYGSYELLYYSISVDTSVKEPGFVMLVETLRNLAFSSQMMFLIYSFLNGLFMWKGICYFVVVPQQILFAIVLYGVMVNLWFESMNAMRQWLAMAIFLWATHFIFEKKTKRFYYLWIVMLLTHFGAIVTCFTSWFYHFRMSRLRHSCLVILVFLISEYIDIASWIVQILVFVSNISGIGSQYIGYVSAAWVQDTLVRPGGTGLGALFSVFIYFVILFLIDTKNKLENFICNMLTISMIIRSLLWFSTPLLRLRGFFEIFLLIGLVLAVERFNKESRLFISLILIIIYAIIGIGFINQISSTDMVNVYYKMNFNLFD